MFQASQANHKKTKKKRVILSRNNVFNVRANTRKTKGKINSKQQFEFPNENVVCIFIIHLSKNNES
jgi:hypothetical protein